MRALVTADRRRVEQRLRRVLVLAVAGVDHRAARTLFAITAAAPPNEWRTTIASGCIAIRLSRGVEQRLALGCRRRGAGDVDRIGRQPLRRDLERRARARRVLEEQVDDRATAQRGQLLDRLTRDATPASSGRRDRGSPRSRQRRGRRCSPGGAARSSYSRSQVVRSAACPCRRIGPIAIGQVIRSSIADRCPDRQGRDGRGLSRARSRRPPRTSRVKVLRNSARSSDPAVHAAIPARGRGPGTHAPPQRRRAARHGRHRRRRSRTSSSSCCAARRCAA